MKKVNKQLLKNVMIFSLGVGVGVLAPVVGIFFVSNEYLELNYDEKMTFSSAIYDEPNKQQQLMSCISIERETKPKKKWVASLVSCVMEVEDQVKNTVEEN
tara:strand:+ start:361 stop:663 length:303 start_codon:yes stop_codon:yes gene_type:complete